MAGGAGWRGKHSVPDAGGLIPESALSPREDRGELIGDGKLQEHAGLGLLGAEREGTKIDALPAERRHLVTVHACIETEAESVADDVSHALSKPLFQQGRTSGDGWMRRRLDAAAARRVERPARIRFDEGQSLAKNCEAFLEAIKVDGPEMAAILREIWDALVEIVRDGERDSRARGELNAEVATALDSLVANPAESRGGA